MNDDRTPDELRQQTYKARSEAWKAVGTLDDQALTFMINPAFAGMPKWPDLRQSYSVVHLENGHTIIATDGLSDPFGAGHTHQDQAKNGFGMELYVEIEEPFDMATAGSKWWFQLLYQESLQVAYHGTILDTLDKYDDILSSELYDVTDLPEDRKNQGRAPVMLGVPSERVPRQVEGPLGPIRFVSLTLLTLDELQHAIGDAANGRRYIADELTKQYGGPLSSLERSSVLADKTPASTVDDPPQAKPAAASPAPAFSLDIKQSWVEESIGVALEEFKSALRDRLNAQRADRHANERWQVSNVSEGDVAYLMYDEKPIATFKVEQSVLHFESLPGALQRHDDIMYAARITAVTMGLTVHSALHGGARLPADPTLALEHTQFVRDAPLRNFFANSKFTMRYCAERTSYEGGKVYVTVGAPMFVEEKSGGAIHLVNHTMLHFLLSKDNQTTNREFSYKVAESMDDFAKKYDLDLLPASFYRNYNKPVKIINDTDFDIENIRRKVFIDPYVFDYDADHGQKYYANVKNGMHLMDKVRKGETLETALRRILREELQVAEDFVGARIWGLEFDRDREGVLTPRLKISVFVHGMDQRQRSKDHDWRSVK